MGLQIAFYLDVFWYIIIVNKLLWNITRILHSKRTYHEAPLV
jgi:hypothetical protein